jgi:hypothetical protein
MSPSARSFAIIRSHIRDGSIGYRKEDLSLAASFQTPSPASGAGIWQSGRGLAGALDNLYFQTGDDNNMQNPASGTLANSFVKLTGSCHSSPGLALAGPPFTPTNSQALSRGDTDLGSSGPLLLPGDRLIGGGKQSRVYVLNSNTMQLTQNQTSPAGLQGFPGLREYVAQLARRAALHTRCRANLPQPAASGQSRPRAVAQRLHK